MAVPGNDKVNTCDQVVRTVTMSVPVNVDLGEADVSPWHVKMEQHTYEGNWQLELNNAVHDYEGTLKVKLQVKEGQVGGIGKTIASGQVVRATLYWTNQEEMHLEINTSDCYVAGSNAGPSETPTQQSRTRMEFLLLLRSQNMGCGRLGVRPGPASSLPSGIPVSASFR